MATNRSLKGIAAKAQYRKSFDAGLAAIAAKAVAPVQSMGYDGDGERSLDGKSSFSFKPSLDRRAQRNISNEQVLEIFPDQGFALDTLVSAILSPKDLATRELNYKPPKNIFSSALAASLTGITKDYFDETHDIRPVLPKILKETLGPYGSYTLVVLPENAIDDFINGSRQVSVEGFVEIGEVAQKSTGLLGNPTAGNISTESRSSRTYDPAMKLMFGHDPRWPEEVKTVESLAYIRVTDNINILKLPKIAQVHRTNEVRKAYASMESNTYARYSGTGAAMASLSQSAIDTLLYQRRTPKTEYISRIRKQSELSRKSIGEPAEIKLPSESIITVFLPGDIENIIGVFVAVDENGNPISRPQETSFGSQSSSSLSASISAGIVSRVATNLGGSVNRVDPTIKAHMDFVYQIASDMMEKDLAARLKNGALATDVMLAKNDDFYTIMLSRQLAKKYTQLLFIPAEYVTYFAFDRAPDGLGKSILDSASQINVMRSTLLYADVMGSMKNSIGRTLLNVKVDETDPNPMRTAERMVHEMIESRQIRFPTTMGNPADQMDLLQRAGIEVNISSPNMPDTSVEFQNVQSSYNKPDQDISDKLQRQNIMRFGMTPELIDTMEQPELATSIVSQNILFAKNVLSYQAAFNPQITKYLRSYARNSQNLKDVLLAALEEAKDQILITQDDVEALYGISVSQEDVDRLKVTIGLQLFLSGFSAELPQPVNVNLEQQAQEFDKFTEAAKKAIDAQISDAFFNEATAGKVSSNVEVFKALVLSQLQRKWMSDRGYMPELAALTATSDDNTAQSSLMHDTLTHVKALTRSCTALMVEVKPMIIAADKDLENNGVEEGSGASSAPDDSGTSEVDDSGGGEPVEPEPAQADQPEETDPFL